MVVEGKGRQGGGGEGDKKSRARGVKTSGMKGVRGHVTTEVVVHGREVQQELQQVACWPNIYCTQCPSEGLSQQVVMGRWVQPLSLPPPPPTPPPPCMGIPNHARVRVRDASGKPHRVTHRVMFFFTWVSGSGLSPLSLPSTTFSFAPAAVMACVMDLHAGAGRCRERHTCTCISTAQGVRV